MAKAPPTIPALNGFFELKMARVSPNGGWAAMRDLFGRRELLQGAADKTLKKGNWFLSIYLRNTMVSQIKKGKQGLKSLRPLTKEIEQARLKFGVGHTVTRGTGEGRTDLPVRENKTLGLDKIMRNRHPLHRTGQMIKSLAIQKVGKDSYILGFPNSKREGSSLTNSELAKLHERGYQFKIPAAPADVTSGPTEAFAFGTTSPIRGFISILAMIRRSMPFPAIAGKTVTVAPRPFRRPTMQQVVARNTKENKEVKQIYQQIFFDELHKATPQLRERFGSLGSAMGSARNKTFAGARGKTKGPRASGIFSRAAARNAGFQKRKTLSTAGLQAFARRGSAKAQARLGTREVGGFLSRASKLGRPSVSKVRTALFSQASQNLTKIMARESRLGTSRANAERILSTMSRPRIEGPPR